MHPKSQIRKYFSKTVPGGVGDDDDIFELGVVDSLFAMQLVLFVEKEFSISVERCDMDIKNFSSISAISGFVTKKLGSTKNLEAERGKPTE